MVRSIAWLALAASAVHCARGKSDESAPAAHVEAAASATAKSESVSVAPRSRSPHWPHITVAITDYRIVYQADPRAREREFDWTARHADRLTLDRGDSISVPEYRRRNPSAQLFRYTLLWTVVRPGEEKRDDAGVSYYGDMQRWYAAHRSLDIERAFLHDARRCPPPAPVSTQCRVEFTVWTQRRWATNPADSAARAYHASRLRALASDVDGLFVDEHGSGDIADKLQNVPLREYPRWEDYQRRVVDLLRAIRAGTGRPLLLNTAEYRTHWDREMIAAAGGTHAENLNDATARDMEARWRFLDEVIAGGALVDVSPKRDVPADYGAGNFATPEDRRRLWQLASYYLIAGGRPGAVAFNLGAKWDRPYSDRWLLAIEADVGRPVAPRTSAAYGRATVWTREFENAVIVVRPAQSAGPSSFGDETGVAIPFATAGLYRPLLADGTLGAPLTRLVLRAGEAAILFKPGHR